MTWKAEKELALNTNLDKELKAEETVIAYIDTLLTAMNDDKITLNEIPNPHSFNRFNRRGQNG